MDLAVVSAAKAAFNQKKKQEEDKSAEKSPLAPPEVVEIKEGMVPMRLHLRAEMLLCSHDDQWYELYKSITNEKDLAEKDQQRMIRRERRKQKKKAKLRAERLGRIKNNLKVRREYRQKESMNMRSTSADRYHDYTDREYEQKLL